MNEDLSLVDRVIGQKSRKIGPDGLPHVAAHVVLAAHKELTKGMSKEEKSARHEELMAKARHLVLGHLKRHLSEGNIPLKDHPYHNKTDNELRYIIKDAGEAARAQKGMSSEGKYLDQVNDASTILHYRKNLKESIVKEDLTHESNSDITEYEHGTIASRKMMHQYDKRKRYAVFHKNGSLHSEHDTHESALNALKSLKTPQKSLNMEQQFSEFGELDLSESLSSLEEGFLTKARQFVFGKTEDESTIENIKNNISGVKDLVASAHKMHRFYKAETRRELLDHINRANSHISKLEKSPGESFRALAIAGHLKSINNIIKNTKNNNKLKLLPKNVKLSEGNDLHEMSKDKLVAYSEKAKKDAWQEMKKGLKDKFVKRIKGVAKAEEKLSK